MQMNLDHDPIQGSAQGANTSNTATLGGSAGKRTYLSTMIVVVGGATAGGTFNVTTTGLQGGNLTIPVQAQTGAALAPQVIQIEFIPPLKRSVLGGDITANLPALGAGNATAGITLTGFLVNEPIAPA